MSQFVTEQPGRAALEGRETGNGAYWKIREGRGDILEGVIVIGDGMVFKPMGWIGHEEGITAEARIVRGAFEEERGGEVEELLKCVEWIGGGSELLDVRGHESIVSDGFLKRMSAVAGFTRIPIIPMFGLNSCDFSYGSDRHADDSGCRAASQYPCAV